MNSHRPHLTALVGHKEKKNNRDTIISGGDPVCVCEELWEWLGMGGNLSYPFPLSRSLLIEVDKVTVKMLLPPVFYCRSKVYQEHI